MIDKNEDYVTNLNLKITVKTFRKNVRNTVVAKQTNKETQRHRK